MSQDTREAFRAIIDATQAADPVPCRECTACCRSHQLVELRWEWGDDPELYAEKVPQYVNGRLSTVLRHKPNGDCIYLGEAGCTVYDRRPIVCRGFDCRRNWMCFTPDQRAEAIRGRVMPADVFAAGEARLGTLHLMSGEEQLYSANLGDTVLRKAGKRS